MSLRFSTGLRDWLNGLEGTVVGALIGAVGGNRAFVDGGGSPDSITDDGDGFVDAGFAPGQKLFVQGSTDGDNDTYITGERILTVAVGVITFATALVQTAQAFAAATCVAVAKGGSLKDILKDGVIHIYSGAQPSSPDDAITGTLLITISVGSGAWAHGTEDYGLEFENDPLSGEMEKNADVWSGVGLAAGVAGWFRFVGNPTDNGAASTILPRIDGSVGVSGADLNMPNTTVAIGNTYTIDSFVLTLPEYYGA